MVIEKTIEIDGKIVTLFKNGIATGWKWNEYGELTNSKEEMWDKLIVMARDYLKNL